MDPKQDKERQNKKCCVPDLRHGKKCEREFNKGRLVGGRDTNHPK